MKSILWILIVTLFSIIDVAAIPPSLVNYQGRLTDPTGNPVADSTYLVRFTLYVDSVSTVPIYWREYHAVTTFNGLFSVTLGTVDPLDYSVLANFPWSAFFGIQVGSDPEMSPRVRLTSVFFAQDASHAYSVTTINQASGGAITGTVKISDSLGIGLGSYPLSERLDVGGNAKVSGMISVQSNAGSTIKPQIGERWRDNSIVAWCHVGPSGEIYGSFGVDSVQHVSTGHYHVYLSNTFVPNTNNMIVTAQAYSTIENHILTSVYPHTSTSQSWLEVGLRLLNTSSDWDNEFVVIVTGR